MLAGTSDMSGYHRRRGVDTRCRHPLREGAGVWLDGHDRTSARAGANGPDWTSVGVPTSVHAVARMRHESRSRHLHAGRARQAMELHHRHPLRHPDRGWQCWSRLTDHRWRVTSDTIRTVWVARTLLSRASRPSRTPTTSTLHGESAGTRRWAGLGSGARPDGRCRLVRSGDVDVHFCRQPS